MKKILILSYFFPPANFVGAQRTAAWANYLHEFGYFPIVITRKWNEGQTDLIDKQGNNQLEVEELKTHEVHRLPYKRSIRDRLSNYPKLKPIQKALTLQELVFSNYFLSSLPFSNFYDYSKELIKNDPSIRIVIVSGRPFQAFSIGYQLKKDFPGILWIPDYRDKWSNNEGVTPNNALEKVIYNLEKKSEKKWTSNCSSFITVSKSWKNDISKLISKNGIVSANGFDKEISVSDEENLKQNKKIRLLYMGSLYGEQNFSILFKAINEINKNEQEAKIHLSFLGSYSNEEGKKALESKTKILGPNVTLMDKVQHKEVTNYLANSDVVVLTSIQNLTGILPVKIYDYYNSGKPILLCPSDNDLMENFIEETESGYIANTQDECKIILESLVEKKKNGQALIGPRNTKNAYFYTRKYQTKLLAEALDRLLEK
ncbi:glycosyltransferase [Brumimicrobium mesophilum]|uniref:glycosyltransferase n=1 Tax=Brumimicrobium mesophilum TaxID=392717 RepID=UPI000D1438F0|nr:glycosyltransferase [Brumimicrobium mesophilum]